jgi:AGZA family xanthine/uracil permease-like MFS transporter
VIIGLVIYQLGLWIGDASGVALVPGRGDKSPVIHPWQPSALTGFYQSSAEWWSAVFGAALMKLPVMLPFALATIVGGIDCTESAAAAGDEYDTSGVLMTEGIASLAAGLLGGVIQTTPYIGHPAYKKMGGRSGYTLANALFIGVAGCFGWFALLFAWMPKAAMFPILVFVGLEITAQSYHATRVKHFPAVALAAIPALAYLIKVPLDMVLIGPPPEAARELVQTLRCLSGGFIVTSLLWASALALILDGRLRAAAFTLVLAGVCALFGIIHSPLPAEQINLPWRVMQQIAPEFWNAVAVQTPYHWAGAYVLSALLLLALSWKDQPVDVEDYPDPPRSAPE